MLTGKSEMIKKGDDDFILAILDVVWTTLDGRVELFTEQFAKIRSIQSVLRRYVSRGQIRTVFQILKTHF